jgi:hypothetical protein
LKDLGERLDQSNFPVKRTLGHHQVTERGLDPSTRRSGLRVVFAGISVG